MAEQFPLFDAPPAPAAQPTPGLAAAPPDTDLLALGSQLPARAYLGTSSWAFPGWAGILYARKAAEAELSRHGLAAYARHPVLRAVGIDRTFYAVIAAKDYAAYAAQVPDTFRFLVKAPAAVSDAVLRDERGRATRANEGFLDAHWALDHFVGPALEGLGAKAGPLVFQLSPLPRDLVRDPAAFAARLHAFLGTIRLQAPQALLAVEARNNEVVGDPLAAALRDAGARYCYGVHARMPTIAEQAGRMSAVAAGPLVARWSLHTGFEYEEAKARYAPFDRLVDPDPVTRSVLADLAARAITGGHDAFIIANNKAEGSAPLTVNLRGGKNVANKAKRRPRASRAFWERGYLSHGYWVGKTKAGRVQLDREAPPERKYRWEAGTTAGHAQSLADAKRAVESAVLLGQRQLALFETPDPR
jgi:uncharacterized protein YecE (DUF72 family)